MKRRWLFPVLVSLVALLAWSFSFAGEPAAPAAAATQTVDVTILHVNDQHGRLESYTAAGKSVGGYARLSTLVQDLRTESKAARVFLLHAGDEFSKGDDLTRATLGAANIALMNYLKFDLWVPGNGDFYDGPANLLARIREAKFRVLAANVAVKATGEAIGKPYVFEKAGPVRIALLGLCLVSQNHASASAYKYASPIETARQLVPDLRKQADLVVAVTHIGADVDEKLAETVGGIDLIVGAHTHTILPTGGRVKGPDGREVLICQTGAYMENLGRVDLKFEKSGAGYRLVSSAAKLIPLDDKIKLDPTVTAMIARMAEKALGTPRTLAPSNKLK